MEFIKNYPIEKLKEWDKNPRNNDLASEKLTKIIEKYGFINPIIIDKKGIIRAGHTRIKSAKKLGLKEVPVLIIDFKSEEEAIGYSLADNKSQEWATLDEEKLAEVLKDLKDKNFNLELTAFSKEAIELLGIDYEDIILTDLNLEGKHLEKKFTLLVYFDDNQEAKKLWDFLKLPYSRKSIDGRIFLEKISNIKNENSHTNL